MADVSSTMYVVVSFEPESGELESVDGVYTSLEAAEAATGGVPWLRVYETTVVS